MSGEADPRGAPAGETSDARRRVLEDARVLATDLEEALERTTRDLRDQLERHPYVTLGAVAAAGYVLAGGLASRITALALGASGRAAMTWLAHEVASGLGSREGRAAPDPREDTA